MEPRRNLVDTRKRKDTPFDDRDTMVKRARSKSPPPMPQIHLGSLLYPIRIPPAQYEKVQSVLNKQENLVRERGYTIEKRCTQIHELKKELAVAEEKIRGHGGRLQRKMEQIADLQAQIKKLRSAGNPTDLARELRERKEYYQGQIEEQDQVLQAGSKFLAAKNQEAERLKKENLELERVIAAKDSQIFYMSNSATGQAVAVAVQVQAQSSLNLVHGLQNDVVERDKIIENYKAEEEKLASDHDKLKGEVEEMKEKMKTVNKNVCTAIAWADEAKSISEEQAKLIQKLMLENARLGENQKV